MESLSTAAPLVSIKGLDEQVLSSCGLPVVKQLGKCPWRIASIVVFLLLLGLLAPLCVQTCDLLARSLSMSFPGPCKILASAACGQLALPMTGVKDLSYSACVERLIQVAKQCKHGVSNLVA